MISAEPKAEADNTYWDLDYSKYHLVSLVLINDHKKKT